MYLDFQMGSTPSVLALLDGSEISCLPVFACLLGFLGRPMVWYGTDGHGIAMESSSSNAPLLSVIVLLRSF